VLTLNDASTRQNFEIVYATAITGSTMTVTRAQEGTSALAWTVGDFVYSPPTAGQMANAGQLGAPNTWTGANTFSQPVSVAASTAAGQAVNQGQFSSSLSANGYKRIPDPNSPSGYYIEQWGSATIAANATTAITLPISFPGQFLSIQICLGSGLSAGNNYAVGADIVNLSQFNATDINNLGNPQGIHWTAKGY
jgi:hypothetical protein